MIISSVLNTYLQSVHTEISGQGFPIFSEIIYEPTLAWDAEARVVTVRSDVDLKVQTGDPNWLVMLWNREVLIPSEVQGRKFIPVRHSDGKTFKARYGDLQVSIAFVSSSIYMLEGLEEFLLVRDPRSSFQVTVPEIGEIVSIVKEWTPTSISKEDLDNYGSLVILTCNVVLGFPVAIPDPGTASLIYYPRYKIYLETYDGSGVQAVPKLYPGRTTIEVVPESTYEKN